MNLLRQLSRCIGVADSWVYGLVHLETSAVATEWALRDDLVWVSDRHARASTNSLKQKYASRIMQELRHYR